MRSVAVGLMALAVAQPALATDLIYKHDKGKPEVLAPYDGFAHWQLEAYCSGMMKARVEWDQAKNRRSPPAEAGAKYFEAEAVARYIADRGADKAKARAVVAYYEDQARAQFKQQVADTPGVYGRTPANMRMTECAAIAVALSPPAAIPPKLVEADPSKQKVVCEEVSPTGSRMSKRICRVTSEAEEQAREDSDTTRRMQEMSGCRNANGSGCF